MAISSFRPARTRPQVTQDLGFIAELSGSWEGQGFNLIARPEASGKSPLFLELNMTFETLNIVPISSAIPNRGDAVPDITLFGLTYLQKVVDLLTQGALHIEPGIWIHNPAGDIPAAEGKPELQNVARMGNIPHGNSLLAEGQAIFLPSLAGNTFDPDKTAPATTAPFAVGTALPASGTQGGFAPYNLADKTSAAVNFRTPVQGDPNPLLPAQILGVPLQDVVNDPTKLLTAALKGQQIQNMVVINVSTVANVPGKVPPISGGGGGIENIPFLQTNANAATMFATFWIETINDPGSGSTFEQLQYVQTVFLNFPIITGGKPGANLSWPHVSVATLRKVFGGQ